MTCSRFIYSIFIFNNSVCFILLSCWKIACLTHGFAIFCCAGRATNKQKCISVFHLYQPLIWTTKTKACLPIGAIIPMSQLRSSLRSRNDPRQNSSNTTMQINTETGGEWMVLLCWRGTDAEIIRALLVQVSNCVCEKGFSHSVAPCPCIHFHSYLLYFTGREWALLSDKHRSFMLLHNSLSCALIRGGAGVKSHSF